MQRAVREVSTQCNGQEELHQVAGFGALFLSFEEVNELMTHPGNLLRWSAVTVAVLVGSAFGQAQLVHMQRACASGPETPDQLELLREEIKRLETDVASLKEKLQFVTVESKELEGLTGPHLIIAGCNLHVRSGSGATDDDEQFTGLGNLIVGYNERPRFVVPERGGTHNLIVGPEHNYPNFGGFAAGFGNTVRGPNCSVSGGQKNEASGPQATVNGGFSNAATGNRATVGGGFSRNAAQDYNWVSGGLLQRR